MKSKTNRYGNVSHKICCVAGSLAVVLQTIVGKGEHACLQEVLFALFSNGLPVDPPGYLTTYVEPIPTNTTWLIGAAPEDTVETSKSNLIYFPQVLWSIYILGVGFFGFIFIRNLGGLVRKIRKNPRHRAGRIVNVLLRDDVTPHTFWNYVFLNKRKFEDNAIPQEVFEHEEAHANQKHSLDIIFMEILQVLFWFNPLIYFIKHAIKLNHEFLADQAVLKKGVDTTAYQKTLLSFSSNELQSNLVNSINYSFIKKRFTVMKTKTTQRTMLLRSLLIVPLLVFLLYSCSTNEIVEKDVGEEIFQGSDLLEITIDNNGSIFVDDKQVNIRELRNSFSPEEYGQTSINALKGAPEESIKEVVDAMLTFGFAENMKVCTADDMDVPGIFASFHDQGEATPEMFAEYNELVSYYNSREDESIGMEDTKRIMKIRGLMTPEQEKKAEPINFMVPPPPPPPAAPQPPGSEDLPTPPSPEQHLKDLTSKGATFFYEGEEVSLKRAISLLNEPNGGPRDFRLYTSGTGAMVMHITDH